MNRKQLLASSIALQGKLEKKSSNFLLGFQEREWKILQQGSKIAYRKPGDQAFTSQRTWRITEVQTEEVEDERNFLLHTPNRSYQLRAESEDVRKQWMRAIAMLRREARRKVGKQEIKGGRVVPMVYSPNPNDSTLPSIDPLHNLTSSALNQTLPPRFTELNNSKLASSFYGSKFFPQDQLKERYGQLLKKMGAAYAHYHVLIAKLTSKSKQLFLTSNTTHHYILFSSKSLLPEEWISEENLTAALLPHWADPDALYRIALPQGRLVCRMAAITDIEESDVDGALRIKTPQETLDFFCESLAVRRRVKEALETGRVNAVQALATGGAKRNYDTLVLLHASNLQEFNAKVAAMLAPLLPTGHSYQLDVFKKLVQAVSPLIVEVMQRLQAKVVIPSAAIADFLRVAHEQVRKCLKLVWDSCMGEAKGGDILNILKSLSRYQSLVSNYVKDSQVDDALKELSKLYMRACFKNFESIILTVVLQQRKDNYYVEQSEIQGEGESEGYLATHGVVDLFKFIYGVFDLAMPCWNNRLHLHNINRLVRRALSIFIRQLRATVDEEDISPLELVAIANNYVGFSEEVQEFYQARLAELKEQTKQTYDQLRDQYRELAMVVVDKLVLPLKIQLKIYFQKQTFYSASLEDAYRKIVDSGVKEYAKKAHFVFKKRYWQRVFGTLREEICKMLEKEAKKIGKKKPELSKVLQRLESYKKDLIDMATLLAGSKLKLQREFDELRLLLTSSKRQEIRTILSQSNEFYKRVCRNILFFRADYFEGSPLQQYLGTLQTQVQVRTGGSDRRRSSFSKYYIQQMDRSSVTSSLEKDRQRGEKERSQSGEEKLRMISEGWVRRVRSGTYEEIYLKLKKSVLYIYQNERMERCHNTVQIDAMLEVSIPNPDKPTFTIGFQALGRKKEMRIKCSTVQECNRWVYTLQLELRRINNDKRMKKVVKIKEKKSRLVIDYQELTNGTDYFSYNT